MLDFKQAPDCCHGSSSKFLRINEKYVTTWNQNFLLFLTDAYAIIAPAACTLHKTSALKTGDLSILFRVILRPGFHLFEKTFSKQPFYFFSVYYPRGAKQQLALLAKAVRD